MILWLWNCSLWFYRETQFVIIQKRSSCPYWKKKQSQQLWWTSTRWKWNEFNLWGYLGCIISYWSVTLVYYVQAQSRKNCWVILNFAKSDHYTSGLLQNRQKPPQLSVWQWSQFPLLFSSHLVNTTVETQLQFASSIIHYVMSKSQLRVAHVGLMQD